MLESSINLRRVLNCAIGLLALAVTVPPSAAAFDYEAHCRISNRALRLAAHQVRPATEEARQQLQRLVNAASTSPCNEGQRNPSWAYGEWVSRVDWALTPGDFFLTPVLPDTVTSAGTAPVEAMARLMQLRLQEYRLLHNNVEHFGSTALYYTRVWHRFATEEAASGRLEAALVYNSFADHYLQDLFAPGHVFTPRRGLNDAVSGAMHNAYNVRGAYYFPANTHLLTRYLGGLVQDQALHRLASVACDPQKKHAARPIRAESPLLPEADLRSCVEALSKDSIAMFGDYQVSRSPAQELFVTLVTARSIEDVLASWAAGRTSPATGVDSFGDALWCGYDVENSGGSRRPWTSPTAVTRFGHQRQERGAGHPDLASWPTVNLSYGIPAYSATGHLDLSFETLTRGLPAEWAEARGQRPPDLTTHRGYDIRIPQDGFDRTSLGVYWRWAASVYELNSRVSRRLGVRARPGDRSFEVHGGLGAEIGFAVAYMELRPDVVWNSNDGFSITVGTGLRVTPPRPDTRVRQELLPPPTLAAPRAPGTPPTCGRNGIRIP